MLIQTRLTKINSKQFLASTAARDSFCCLVFAKSCKLIMGYDFSVYFVSKFLESGSTND